MPEPTGKDDSEFPRSPGGILDRLRALLDTVLALLYNRAELVATELEEEVARLVRVLLWALAAVLSAIIGAAFLGATILLAMSPGYRVLTAGILGLLFLGITGFGYLAIRKTVREKARPFDASLRELEKDRERLRSDR